jgi:hypothetical protein
MLNILISGGDSTDPAQAPVNSSQAATNKCLAQLNKTWRGGQCD